MLTINNPTHFINELLHTKRKKNIVCLTDSLSGSCLLSMGLYYFYKGKSTRLVFQ